MSSSPPMLSTPPLTTPPTPPPTVGLPVLWMVLSAAVGIAIGAGAVLLFRGGSEVPNVPAVSVSAPDVEVAPPEDPKPVMPTPLELAAKADPDALKTLKSKSEADRSVAEWVALEKSVAASERNRIAELKHKIELLPAFGRTKSTKKEIVKLARDSRYFIDTLEMLASLKDNVGADLIYSTWAGTRKSSNATELAKALSYTKEVRGRTSTALGIALDLRTVDDCDKLKGLLEKAKAQGDRRSLNPLRRFNHRTGCGESKKNDCWACVRKTDLLRDASAAVREKAPPL